MTDEDLKGLRAMAHPVRLRMVSLLTGSAMSAAEVARELGLTHANASYHLRILLDSGEIVEAGEERIRGGVAKKYRYPHELRGHNPRRTLAQPPVATRSIPRLRLLFSSLERTTTLPRKKLVVKCPNHARNAGQICVRDN